MPVPALDPVVGGHRAVLDTAAGWGVPAHVTVLHPFVDPADAAAAVTRARIAAAVAQVPAFHCAFGGTHGDDVVPHLTVGERRNGTLERLRQAEHDLQLALPVTATIDRLWLIAGAAEARSWRLVEEFPLAQ